MSTLPMEQFDIGGCWLQTADSPDGNLYLEAEDAYKFQGYVDGDTLYVKSTSKLPSDAGDCRVVIFRPIHVVVSAFIIAVVHGTVRDFVYGVGRAVKVQVHHHEVEVELGAGQMDFGTLYANSASLEVGAGQITVYDRAEISDLAGQNLSTSPLKTCLSLENSTSWSSSGQSMSSYRERLCDHSIDILGNRDGAGGGGRQDCRGHGRSPSARPPAPPLPHGTDSPWADTG